jgi:hypothetical protein
VRSQRKVLDYQALAGVARKNYAALGETPALPGLLG